MNLALRVLKNATALSLSILLERGIALFLPWYVARVQGKEVWGHYSTALTFITISVSFAYWGLYQLLPREIARDRARSGTLLAQAGIISSVTSILTTIFALTVVHFLRYPPHVQHLINVGIILIIFPRTEAAMCEAVINGMEKMEWIVAVRFPTTILRIAVSIYLLSRGFGLQSLFIVLSAYHMLVCGVYLALFKHFVPGFRLRLDWSLICPLASQAVPFVMIVAIGETFKQIDRVFLSKLWDTDLVGIYATGIMLVQIMYMIAPAIMNAIFPELSRAFVISKQRFASLVSQIFKLLFIGVFPIALTIITFADLIILLIFGQEYIPSIIVLRIYAMGIVPSFIARFLYRVILASDNERMAIKVTFVNSVVSLVLNLILIPSYGVLGASVTAVCTEIVGLVQNLFYVSHRMHGINLTRALLKPGICALTSTLAYLGTMRWGFSIAWIVSSLVFAGMLLASRTISHQDLAALPTIRARSSVKKNQNTR